MRERRNGLAHGRKSLRLDLVVVKYCVFNRQPGLVPDGNHQRKLLFAEAASLIGFIASRNRSGHVGLDIGVEDTQRRMPSLNRNADRLANLVIDDRLCGAEPFVGRRIGGDHPLPLLEHVVDDRLRDRHPFVGLGHGAPPHRLGQQRACLILEQDRATIRPDRLEHQFEDLGR